jgi:hypothetical protein
VGTGDTALAERSETGRETGSNAKSECVTGGALAARLALDAAEAAHADCHVSLCQLRANACIAPSRVAP